MFENLRLAFRIIKVYKLVKEEIEYAQDSDTYKRIKTDIENIIASVKDLLEVIPEGKEEIEVITDKFKGIIK